jgi:hypothetical protein
MVAQKVPDRLLSTGSRPSLDSAIRTAVDQALVGLTPSAVARAEATEQPLAELRRVLATAEHNRVAHATETEGLDTALDYLRTACVHLSYGEVLQARTLLTVARSAFTAQPDFVAKTAPKPGY